MHQGQFSEQATPTGRDWVQLLDKYRLPSALRGAFELIVTLIPLIALWVFAWLALSVSIWLTLLITIPTAGFLVRLFMIQHDCGHGAFFRRRATNDWVGRIIGVLNAYSLRCLATEPRYSPRNDRKSRPTRNR